MNSSHPSYAVQVLKSQYAHLENNHGQSAESPRANSRSLRQVVSGWVQRINKA